MKSLKLNMRIISILLLVLAFILMFFSMMKIKTANTLIEKKADIEVNRRTCLAQSQLLSKTSDYLTSQMQNFLATGKKEYLDNYWNEVENVRQRDTAIEKLSTLNLTDEEKSLVNRAKKNSDSLIPKETWAMRLIAESINVDEKNMPRSIAKVRLTPNETSLSPNEKRSLVIQYVLGEKYTTAKESIKEDLYEFHTLLSDRKDKELSAAIKNSQATLNTIQIYNATILLLLLVSFIVFYALVMKPFRKYSISLNHLDESNLTPLTPLGSTEMRSFANVFNEIYSNLQTQNKRLKELNLKDTLTKIPNRGSLDSYIEKALKEKTYNLGLLILDVDSFKAFNDNYGHLAGDKILIQIASCLVDAVPKNLGIAGRLSGEEFIVAIPNTTPSGIDSLANDILNRIRGINMKHADLPLIDTHITASIGSVLWDGKENCTKKDLIQKADLALYEAKNNGKNQHIMFSPNHSTFILLQNSHAHDAEVESEMHRALKNGEFVPYYQPKYNINSGAIVSLEALIRWIHPVKGVLAPNYFIPLFERNGFIKEVDLYIFEKVCQTLESWINEGKNIVPVACNFSRLNFKDLHLADKLKGISDKYSIPPSYLEIEVTESALIDDNDNIVNQLNKLRKIGFSVAIDDFGVGYSSLGILQELPVDVVKVDRSFLQRDLNDRKNVMIISGILYIAKVLNLEPVCEGVETSEQMALLRDIGCNIVQGYYYSKPVNRVEIEHLLNQNNKMLLNKNFITYSPEDAPRLVEALLQQFYSSQNIDAIKFYVTKEIEWKGIYLKSTILGIDDLLKYHKEHILGHSFILTTYPFKSSFQGNNKVIVSGEGSIAEFSKNSIYSRSFCFNATCALINNSLKVDKLTILEIKGEIAKKPHLLNNRPSSSNIEIRDQAFLDQFYSLLPLGIVRYDFKEDMKITYINDYFLDILGYTRKQFKEELNNNLRMAVYPEDLDLIYEKSYEFINNPETPPLRYRLLRRDGKIITVEYTQCNVMGVNGVPEVQGMYIKIS